MKVWLVAPEVTPFRKTGGLGDVSGALPKALKRRGVDVRVVMPLYGGVPWNELERLDGVLDVPMYYGSARAGVRLGQLPRSDVPIYFIEHHGYFDRHEVYGEPERAYPDNLERFTFFSRASLSLAGAVGFDAEVVHAHDWPTALVPTYIDTVMRPTPLGRAATVFTIHNLAHQGNFGGGAFFITGLDRDLYAPHTLEHFGDVNLMKGAIQRCTLLTTVSPNYAREIQTPDHGFGLDGVLAARGGDLHGILNGIDSEEWNPETDPHLPAGFHARDLSGKRACKKALQEELGLPSRPDVPLFGIIARLTPQKGLDVLAESLGTLLGWNLQMVLLGTGNPELERAFHEISARRPDRFRARIGFDNALAHRIEAGSDFFVMPSRFEPCGLNQLYSLRYGTLPIVRATGGLVDTVLNYDESSGAGTGFAFHSLDAASLTNTIGWALSTYFDRPKHVDAMRRRAMAQDYSWDRAAEQYERVYVEARERRRGNPPFVA